MKEIIFFQKNRPQDAPSSIRQQCLLLSHFTGSRRVRVGGKQRWPREKIKLTSLSFFPGCCVTVPLCHARLWGVVFIALKPNEWVKI